MIKVYASATHVQQARYVNQHRSNRVRTQGIKLRSHVDDLMALVHVGAERRTSIHERNHAGVSIMHNDVCVSKSVREAKRKETLVILAMVLCAMPTDFFDDFCASESYKIFRPAFQSGAKRFAPKMFTKDNVGCYSF